MSTAGGKQPWFSRTAIPPIILLSFLTSFAFNHALITSQRADEVRRHQTQMQVLQDILRYRTSQLYTLTAQSNNNGLLSWFGRGKATLPVPQTVDVEEEEALVRRIFSIGLDPRMYGFALPTAIGIARSAPRETNWSDILLGSKETRTSVSDKWAIVGAGIRNAFSSTTTNISPNHSDSDQQELDALEQAWLAALDSESKRSQEE